MKTKINVPLPLISINDKLSLAAKDPLGVWKLHSLRIKICFLLAYVNNIKQLLNRLITINRTICFAATKEGDSLSWLFTKTSKAELIFFMALLIFTC